MMTSVSARSKIGSWSAQQYGLNKTPSGWTRRLAIFHYEFFAALEEGPPFQPRHALITNQATRYQDRMVLGVSTDGLTYAAFLPQGGTISVDLQALAGITIGVTWYHPLTGHYHDQGTTAGGGVRALVSPFGMSPAALVLMAH
jgi:collagenase-like protein with putative collagen-binding domain